MLLVDGQSISLQTKNIKVISCRKLLEIEKSIKIVTKNSGNIAT